jgi:hypothetical protein
MSAGFHTTLLLASKPPNNYVSGKVSSQSIINMQNGGRDRVPKTRAGHDQGTWTFLPERGFCGT